MLEEMERHCKSIFGAMIAALIIVAAATASSSITSENIANKVVVNPGVGGPGIKPAAMREITLRALPEATAGDISARPSMRVRPLTGASEREYAARKAIAASRVSKINAPKTPALISSEGASRQANALEVSFAGNAQIECGGATPPNSPSDQALAIGDGAAPILQVNNDCLSVWSSTGTRLLAPRTLQAFAGLPARAYVFAPRAIYDWRYHRYIVAFGDSDLVATSYYNIAVSVGDNPTGAWRHYRLQAPTRGNTFADFIRLGQDRQGVYVASNLFNLSRGVIGSYLFEEWLFLPKSLLYAGTLASHYWYQSGMQVSSHYTDSTQPANVWSPYENPRAEFLVTSFNINYGGGNCVTGCSGVAVWAVSNPFGWINGGPTPEVSGYCCASTSIYSLPPNASQPGAPNSIETLDTRITGGVAYKSGLLYAALTTGDSNWSDIVVYRIMPSLGNENTRCAGSYQFKCPRINDAITFDENRANYNGNFAYYPTSQPDLEGNVLTVFNFSGPDCATCYPSVAFQLRRATAPHGLFTDYGFLFAIGAARFNSLQWGRYTAAAPIGVGYLNNGAVAISGIGFAGSFAKTGVKWATQIGVRAYTAPNQP